MPRRPYTAHSRPSRADLLDAMDEAERRLSEMIGRWSDSIPAPVRAELHEIGAPLLRLLLRAGKRP